MILEDRVWQSIHDCIVVRKHKRAQTGFTNFNCPMCHEHRLRCGVINSDGVTTVSCFNCQSKFSYRFGFRVNQEMRTFLSSLGIPDREVAGLVYYADQIRREVADNPQLQRSLNIVVTTEFPSVALPSGARALEEWCKDSCDDTDFLATVAYLLSRGDGAVHATTYYWTPRRALRRRLIIPCYQDARLVGWVARAVDPEVTQRYHKELPGNYLFNTQFLTGKRRFVPIVEGAFDALLIDGVAALGASLVEFDLEPLYETARLLYEGPWVAERYLVIRDLLASSPDAIHPVTREITIAGARLSAADTFAALYRLQVLRKISERAFAGIDALVLPTAPTAYSTAQVLANPVELNSRLGTYTNFVNLLDLCGLALPAAIRPDDIPFGITLLAPAGHDAQLASIGRVFHADTGLTIGARNLPQPPLAALPADNNGDEIAIAVVGAHLSGMVLNGELKALGGRLLESTLTAPDYRLYALATTPPKPGMLRVAAGAGSSIAVEVWALSAAAFGKFVAAIPPPLSIGTVRLADGRGVKGFIVEPADIDGARDISAYGGWRAFMAEKVAV